jgi:flavorubredoxin
LEKEILKGDKDIRSVIILYDSMFGNTKKVALALNRGLEAGGLYVDSLSIEDFGTTELSNYDLIGIGSPTHMRGISKPMKLFLSKMKRFKLKNKKGFIFETKASFLLSGSAAKKILRYFKMMKVKLVFPIITGIVLGKEGPLEDNTLTKMEEIGLEIAEKLNKSI